MNKSAMIQAMGITPATRWIDLQFDLICKAMDEAKAGNNDKAISLTFWAARIVNNDAFMPQAQIDALYDALKA